MTDLSSALNVPARRQEAAEALRGLIEAITLVPVDGALQIELVGALAGILALGKEERPRPGARGRKITLVAGARNQRCQRWSLKSAQCATLGP